MKNELNIPILSAYYSMRKPGQMDKSHGVEDPKVILDADNCTFTISGSSEPENAKEFFSDIFIWLEIYSLCPLSNQVLEVNLADFNSSSSLYLLKMFEMWLSIDYDNKVIWRYSKADQSMNEAGLEYKEMVGERFMLNPHDLSIS